MNRDAEASGTVLPRDVSLTDGTFKSDVPYHHDGDRDVAQGEKTSFDVVLRQTDSSHFEDQARMEWAYQIVKDGKKTGVWVAGVSTNHRSPIKFSADGRCALYGSNPLAGTSHLDDRKPLEKSSYFCSADGRFVHGPGEDGNGHYDADFFIGKR